MKIKMLFSLPIMAFALTGPMAHADTKQSIGWIEPVSIDKGALNVLAKIDTGADTSSLNAINVSEFEKQGRRWVSFMITNRQGFTHKIIKPIASYVHIKRKGAAPQQRPVILMDICLGNQSKTMKVNLANRENYKYQMLIGRKFLKGSFAVDSELTQVTKPGCSYQTALK
jgi:hypothetical protein